MVIKRFLFCCLVCISFSVLAQPGFVLANHKKKDKIPFKLINNLPVLPVEVNGTNLSFILDTGVKSTILFSLEDADSLVLKNTEPIQLQGLGQGGAVDALKSRNNRLKVGNAVDNDHNLYVIFDKSLNFSPRMGIPIHGILGSDFFQNFVVEIRYGTGKIIVYDPNGYSFKKCHRCEDLDITFVNSKPYIPLKKIVSDEPKTINLLVDSGSSDVLWLFDDEGFLNEDPKNYFEDFLGLGLSGNIFGKRTKLPEIRLGKISLEDVNAAFPEESAINKARIYKERDGSVGGGFLSKFNVTLDYANKKMRFKKNRKFREPFHYNMSGLTIEHEGMELVKREKQARINSNSLISEQDSSTSNVVSVPVTTEYEFSLVPRYIIVDVRKDSPAALAGLQKGDEIISINGKPCYDYELADLIEMFSSDEGKKITMEAKRDDNNLRVKFYLKSIL